MLVSILTMNQNYPEIWTDFSVPDHIDRDMVINSICIECAELALLYSDPDILKYIIKNWTDKNLPVWNNLQATLEYQYNPIWNVEGSETMTITTSNTENRNLLDTRTVNLTDERTLDLENERTPDLTTTDSVAGYNQSTPDVRNKTEEDGTDTTTTTGTDTVDRTGTESTANTGNVNVTGNETRVFSRGMNLGVMTTQQLIREQRELVQFTVADYITNSFKQNFCLMVY